MRQQDNDNDMQMALLWFGQHGSDHTLHSALDHGHFDGLHMSWFNRGQEVLHDYGFGRWVNIEPKFGGRYIPENNSYCKQTIAHNTVVVDEKSQHDGNTVTAEKNWGEKHFFITNQAANQGVSAFANGYYDGVDMQRTVLLLSLEGFSAPVLVDLFRLTSASEHQYDYPVHYNGQIITTNFDYCAHESLSPLGRESGYQHLWELARSTAGAIDGSAAVTWLMANSYYTVTTALPAGSEAIMVRTGANDPDFNLRSEPAIIFRTRGTDQLFATAYETHGYFNEATEASTDARSSISHIEVIEHNQAVSALLIQTTFDTRHIILISNKSQQQTPAQQNIGFAGNSYILRGMFSVHNL